jgi:hypothetical protein
MLVYEEDYGFEDISRTSHLGSERGGRGEKTTCQLNAGLIGKVLEEIGDPVEWRLTLGRGC